METLLIGGMNDRQRDSEGIKTAAIGRSVLNWRSTKYQRMLYGGQMPLNEPKNPPKEPPFFYDASLGKGPNARFIHSSHVFPICPGWSHVQEEFQEGFVWLGDCFAQFLDGCTFATCWASSATVEEEICL